MVVAFVLVMILAALFIAVTIGHANSPRSSNARGTVARGKATALR
jgi:hypothetical protein